MTWLSGAASTARKCFPALSTREVVSMRSLDRFLDEAANYVWAKKTEVVFNLVLTIIGTGLTLLMIAWLIHQVRAMWGL
jgi:hypothetical protein